MTNLLGKKKLFPNPDPEPGWLSLHCELCNIKCITARAHYNIESHVSIFFNDALCVTCYIPLSSTECIRIVIQLCLRSQIGMWEKYYYRLFDITNYFSSNGGFTYILFFGLWDGLVRRRSTECQLCKGNMHAIPVMNYGDFDVYAGCVGDLFKYWLWIFQLQWSQLLCV